MQNETPLVDLTTILEALEKLRADRRTGTLFITTDSGHAVRFVLNKGDVIDTIAKRSDDVTQHLARFTVRSKPKRRLHPRAKTILKRFDMFAEVRCLAVMLFQRGLMVKQVDVAGRPAHE